MSYQKIIRPESFLKERKQVTIPSAEYTTKFTRSTRPEIYNYCHKTGKQNSYSSKVLNKNYQLQTQQILDNLFYLKVEVRLNNNVLLVVNHFVVHNNKQQQDQQQYQEMKLKHLKFSIYNHSFKNQKRRNKYKYLRKLIIQEKRE